ncbi:hypothetical protein L9F63_017164, partial [Diploptera punctata]
KNVSHVPLTSSQKFLGLSAMSTVSNIISKFVQWKTGNLYYTYVTVLGVKEWIHD